MDAWPLVKSYVPDAKLVIMGTRNDEDRLNELTYKSNEVINEKDAGLGLGSRRCGESWIKTAQKHSEPHAGACNKQVLGPKRSVSEADLAEKAARY